MSNFKLRSLFWDGEWGKVPARHVSTLEYGEYDCRVVAAISIVLDIGKDDGGKLFEASFIIAINVNFFKGYMLRRLICTY